MATDPKIDRETDRKTLKLERISNGFVVKIYPKMFAFTTLREALEFVRDHFEHGDGKA